MRLIIAIDRERTMDRSGLVRFVFVMHRMLLQWQIWDIFWFNYMQLLYVLLKHFWILHCRCQIHIRWSPIMLFLWEIDLHQTCITLHKSAAICSVFTLIHKRRLSGLVIEHVQKQSALLGVFCTHMRPYCVQDHTQVTYRRCRQSVCVLLASICAFMHF